MSCGPEKLMPPLELVECAVCSRSFTRERLNIHEAICQKSSTIKRKCFDTSQQRLRGTDAERLGKMTSKNECITSDQKRDPCGLMTNWRGKHEDFLRQIKESKDRVSEKSKKVNDLPFPPPSDYDKKHVQCQHCMRQVNEATALRHISNCAKSGKI